MPPPPASSGVGLSGVKLIVVMVTFGLAIYILGPSLYWRIARASSADLGTCAPCMCECLPESESTLLPGFGNSPTSDCDKVDPVLKEDVDKTSLELLSEELKLQETVAEESQSHADSALLDAKKLASQYQKEAEKCNAGMETCEEAREKSDLAVAAQKKISEIWEKRARELGWRDRPERQSIFSRIGLSGQQSDSSFFRRKNKL